MLPRTKALPSAAGQAVTYPRPAPSTNERAAPLTRLTKPHTTSQSLPWKQDLMSLGDCFRDGETEAQRGKARCPMTHSLVAEPRLLASSRFLEGSLELPWQREVKLKGRGMGWSGQGLWQGTQPCGLAGITRGQLLVHKGSGS